MTDAGGEIAAITTINEAMKDLAPDEARRVLRWAVDRFGSSVEDDAPGDRALEEALGGATGGGGGRGGGGAKRYERIADLMDDAAPETGADHVLVAGYWFQVVQGEENMTAQQVNSELKNLGHKVANITDAFSQLIERQPALVRQVQKSGTSRQARKKYRLTEAGMRRVRAMIAGTADE
jgi:hypothetical protein